jgi:8-oxo-dGTP pyrophosphatase MutT (NUDIX family)
MALTPDSDGDDDVAPSDENRRVVAGCVPLRFLGTDEATGGMLPDIGNDGGSRVQCLLVTSKRRPNILVFPKGGVKRSDASWEAAAKRETWEEAGVEGRIIGDEITILASVLTELDPTGQDNHWFELQVTVVHDDWPEQGQRQRLWVCIYARLPAYLSSYRELWTACCGTMELPTRTTTVPACQGRMRP